MRNVNVRRDLQIYIMDSMVILTVYGRDKIVEKNFGNENSEEKRGDLDRNGIKNLRSESDNMGRERCKRLRNEMKELNKCVQL